MSEKCRVSRSSLEIDESLVDFWSPYDLVVGLSTAREVCMESHHDSLMKSAIEIREAKKSTKFSDNLWFWEVKDGLDFVRHWTSSGCVDNIPEELNLGLTKYTLAWVNHSIIPKSVEEFSLVYHVSGLVRRCDEYIINVCIAVVQATNHFINIALESLCSIAQTETHEWELKKSERCRHCSLWNIFSSTGM